MEVDRVAESEFVSESAATCFDHLDPAVDALSMAIVHIKNDGIDDAPEMIANGRRRLHHQFQPATHSPT